MPACLAFALERHVWRVVLRVGAHLLVAVLQRRAHVVSALVSSVCERLMLPLFLFACVGSRSLHVDVHTRGVAELVVQLQSHLVLLLLLASGVLVLLLLILPLLVALLTLVHCLTLATLPSLQPLVSLHALPLNEWVALVLVIVLILMLNILAWTWRRESVLHYFLVLAPAVKGIVLLWLL